MTWIVKPCQLTEDSIEEIKGQPTTSYKPFDYYIKGEKELYTEFAAIDEDDPKAILKFISKYGFLGFKNDIERKHRKDLKSAEEIHEKINEAYRDIAVDAIKRVLENPFSAYDLIQESISMSNDKKSESSEKQNADNKTPQQLAEDLQQYILNMPPESEKIEDIKREILAMRCLVLMWIGLNTRSRDMVLDQLKHLYLLDYTNPDRTNIKITPEELVAETMESFNDTMDAYVFYHGSRLLSRLVNKHLKGVSPMLSNYNNILDCTNFTEFWDTPHLLSAMYVMFYMDLTRGVTLRKCQNQTCRQFFTVYGNDERKIYCSESCANAQKQREYRRRKKAKEV